MLPYIIRPRHIKPNTKPTTLEELPHPEYSNTYTSLIPNPQSQNPTQSHDQPREHAGQSQLQHQPNPNLQHSSPSPSPITLNLKHQPLQPTPSQPRAPRAPLASNPHPNLRNRPSKKRIPTELRPRQHPSIKHEQQTSRSILPPKHTDKQGYLRTNTAAWSSRFRFRICICSASLPRTRCIYIDTGWIRSTRLDRRRVSGKYIRI